ncbi:MAG: type II toxin-antitoxin system RelE/ParE family toxin, partial [Terriglobales bacterium]
MIKLIFSPRAENDLQDIGDFIAQDNLDAAISFVERLRQRC